MHIRKSKHLDTRHIKHMTPTNLGDFRHGKGIVLYQGAERYALAATIDAFPIGWL